MSFRFRRPPADNSPLEWLLWSKNRRRNIIKTTIKDKIVTTDFVGIFGPILIFETTVFGAGKEEFCERASTREKAEVIHNRVVDQIKSASIGSKAES